jgi:hypothetical protein
MDSLVVCIGCSGKIGISFSIEVNGKSSWFQKNG